MLKDGFINRVGKGCISLWYDKWLDRGCLCNHVPFVSIHDTQLLIKDVFYDGKWHFENLATQLPEDIKLETQSVFIDDNTEDILIWSASNSGDYSARSAFRWMLHQDHIHSPNMDSN